MTPLQVLAKLFLGLAAATVMGLAVMAVTGDNGLALVAGFGAGMAVMLGRPSGKRQRSDDDKGCEHSGRKDSPIGKLTRRVRENPMAVVLVIAVLALLWATRYQVVGAGSGSAVVINRWTGSVYFIRGASSHDAGNLLFTGRWPTSGAFGWHTLGAAPLHGGSTVTPSWWEEVKRRDFGEWADDDTKYSGGMR